MSIESFNQNIDKQPKLQDSLEYQEQLQEKVLKIEQEQKYASKLAKVNDVLKVLDLPDEQDDILREILMWLDDKTLVELAIKPKSEIKKFILNSDNNNLEKIEQKKLHKFEELKSILTPEILQKHTKLQEVLNDWNIENIIEQLQEDLPNLVQDLGWVGSKDYETFKTTLLSLDSEAFTPIFDNIENEYNSSLTIDTNEIINSIENNSWWKIDIDLKAMPPVSKMSLVDSEYSFDKKIDLKALTELRSDIKADLEAIANGNTILNDFDKSFSNLLSTIAKNWNNENFNNILLDIVTNFSKDIFSDLNEVYQDMDIPSEIQINEFDITNLSAINSQTDLKHHIETIQEKSTKIKEFIWAKQETVLMDSKDEIKELLQRESNEKERQLWVLKFMKNCWFDKIPKELSNKIIDNLKSNVLIIPWMNLNPQNIDLANGHFGETSVFDSENGLTPNAKTNMVMFMNKLISWNTNEPLNVSAIANWTIVAQPWKLRDEFNKAKIVWNLGWNYTKMMENLRKENQEK